jgi:sRNA-binding protein
MNNERYKVAVLIIESLCERWPQCFVIFQKRRPLKLRIDQDIAVAAPGVFTPAELEIGLRFYTGNIGYLRACREGVSRIDLLRNVVGTVTKDEAEYAAGIIAHRRSKKPSSPAFPSVASTRAQVAEKQAEVETGLTNSPAKSGGIIVEATPAPKRISLADLRAAAARRKAVPS